MPMPDNTPGLIRAGQKLIGTGQPVFIIAEAGVNHNGDPGLARALIDAACAAGADAVKFQSFRAAALNTPAAPKSSYHIETTGNEQSWLDLLKSQELSAVRHHELAEYCANKGILFLSTPYDRQSVDLLCELEVPLLKIASTDANNIPFLRYVAEKGLPVILSTAMCTLDEVRRSAEVFTSAAVPLVLLHCTANYPARPEDSNLRAMLTMQREFGVPVGYSDHTPGDVNTIAAVALGACVYEKHFTLDKQLPGPDHRASLAPDELLRMVANIRATEQALGSAEKAPVPAESENRLKLRKSLVAARAIPAGALITPAMLTEKRPGTGLEPARAHELIGKRARQGIAENTLLTMELFE